MPTDANEILKRARGEEPERGRISLYIDKGLWQEFQGHCGESSASRVVEELMRDFLKSIKSNKLLGADVTPYWPAAEPDPLKKKK